MKKNLLFHPLVKGLCLILCLTALLGCAYTGLRCVFMDATGVMNKSPEFSPDTYNGYIAGEVLYWPEYYEWNEFVFISGEARDYYRDDLLNRVVDLLSAEEFSDYFAVPVKDGNSAAADTLYDEVEEELSTGADTTTENAASPAAADKGMMPDLLIDSDSGCIYPAFARRYALDFLDWFPKDHSNLRFCVLLDGIPMFGNSTDMDSEALQNEVTYSAAIHGDGGDTGHTLSIRLGLCAGLPVDDTYRVYYEQWEYDIAHWEEWMVATGILAIASLVFLCIVLVQAGRRYAIPGIHLNVIDRLPLEPVLAVKAAVLLFAIACAMEMGWSYRYETLLVFFGYQRGNIRDWLIPAVVAGLVVVVIVMGLWILVGGVKRLRAGGFWRNTLTYRILRLFVRGFRIVWSRLRLLTDNLPLTGKWLAGCAIFGLWTLIVMNSHGLEVLWFFTALAAGLFLCFYMLELDVVRRGAKKIASGDINHHTDTARLHGAPKQIGDSLNHIGDAISVAVEDRMKSERFRTELITNVSHDLKTPLTSIINYTDLLSKEECENETMREYIDVLIKQSARLKKLTEDLLEASKASTGTLSVQLAPTDAAELLAQAVGEYEERIAAAQLHLIMNVSGTPLYIMADGKHLWRVFDNLLSNICKYSMCGTRVYLSADVSCGEVVISFRNISENPITVSADELTERFVRGDSSRHTEGSGLGLAIASSLCGLQSGVLDLLVDGDLFKAVVRFPAIPAPADARTDEASNG